MTKKTTNTLLGLAAGFGAYHLLKRSGAMFGLGDEAVYGYLMDLGRQADRATKLYQEKERKIRQLDERLGEEGNKFLQEEPDRKMAALARIKELQRQRDDAVLEASLILRDVLNPIRSRMITEEARLKSLVVAPSIALKRAGFIPGRGMF